jgi:uncharacterized protein (DUF885 family)
MREPFEIAHDLVEEWVQLSPMRGTRLGIPGSNGRWDDFSPAGHDSKADMYKRYRIEMAAHLHHPDGWQRHAARVVHDRLGEGLEAHERGDHLRRVRHTAGDFDAIREIFDQMDTTTAEGWSDVIQRLESVEVPFRQLEETLTEGMRRGMLAARRQVLSVIEQARHLAGEESTWLGLVGKAAPFGEPVASRVDAAVGRGRAAAGRLAMFLESTYLPAAPDADGVGRDRYVAEAEPFLGLPIDPDETYEWGWDEVHGIAQSMAALADEIYPGASVEEAIARLDSDDSAAAPSQAAFAEFIQHRQDQALALLDHVHFDVPEQIKKVTVNLVPPGAALGAYYIEPSEDFTRPGSIWYSFGTRQLIPLWSEVSTAYHEGFPGHHLQVGTVMTLKENLSRAHRLLIWYSGYGEGWALYTERLMDELGYLERPEYRLGLFSLQQLRACRVVIDIGCHLGLRIPDHSPVAPGEIWTFDHGVELLHRVAGLPREVAESEMTRYLGWPGQAISYKVGERHILALRQDRARRLGSAFDLKEFHRWLLGWGEVRLDYLQELSAAG